jgi:iron only hydrogenase large subunit-like protein
MPSPVYTIENECQDCYKCVRHCPVKAIRVLGGKASVIPEACVACGECVKVCPAHAKKVRIDLPRLRELLKSGERVYASIAPSFPGHFRGVTIERLSAALIRLGFAGVSETAHGAQSVSAHISRLLELSDSPLVISSACPAAVDMLRKYRPEFASFISPLPSPVRAHARLLREKFGNDIKVVFFGPCAAKKNEADAHPNELSLAIMFPALEEILRENGINIVSETAEAAPALGPAEEGRFYAIEGGMNDTLRNGSDKVRHISVSGLEHFRRLLANFNPADFKHHPRLYSRKLFIEVLACPGGCMNGPAMPQGAFGLETLFATDANAPIATSASRNFSHCGTASYPPVALPLQRPNETVLASALARVGKFSKADELNCGACGYNSCRDFAHAMLEGKAEESMCHNYLRRNFQRTSNALIRYIPAAVVIVDENLHISECNRNFATLAGAMEIYETLGNLNGIAVDKYLPNFSDLFKGALEYGGEAEKFHQRYRDKIVNISVFPIADGKSVGAVVQDVTKNEFRREQIADKAREVIRKNVYTVQQVARLFGEHIAETEIMLNEIAGTYEAQITAESRGNVMPSGGFN